MKHITCKRCGKHFKIDPTPESAREMEVIQAGTDYNDDTLCSSCFKATVKPQVKKEL
jgi:hypothetical protein